MKKYKSIIVFLILFFSFLFINLFVHQLQSDEVWNYGFAHNIYKGLIPYKDFNMVITPFYPFIMSLIFHVFGSSMLVFHIENAIILVVLCYLIYKLIGNNIYLIGIITLVFSIYVTFPNYNLFLLFLFVIILYLEKKEKNDYLIGIIIGFVLLTKQSVGLFFILPSLYYLKNKKKLLHRFIGFIVPCFIFLLFLLINKNFYGFIDLCFFGLFDFGSNNTPGFNFGYIALIMYLIITGYLIYKNKNNINNYYALAFSTMMIPLVDIHHSIIGFIGLLIVVLMAYNINFKISLKLILVVCFIIISTINIYRYNDGYKIIYPNDLNHFQYRYIRDDSLEFSHAILAYLNQNSDRDFVFLTSGAYYYRIITDTPITYLDLINYGNYGYHGSDKIINDIKDKKDSLFIIYKDELDEKCQADKTAMKYVIKNGKKIDSVMIYDIYELK